MKNILVTGGTIFVSKFVAQYFSSKKFCDEYKVYVLNRNNHLQVENVILINSSRQNLGSKLEQFNFDIVIDITSYTKEDVKSILDSLGSSKEKIEKFEAEGKKTISLTVGKMLTGCTVKEWDTMIFLRNTASPQDYDQAIFRLQSQYVKTLESDDDKIIRHDMKPQTILVDFDPVRMYTLQH